MAKPGSIWSGNGPRLWDRIIRADCSLSHWVANELIPAPWKEGSRYLFIGLEYTGHAVPWILVSLWMLASAVDHSSRRVAVMLLLGMVMDLLFVCVVKALAARPRPSYNDQHVLQTIALDRDNAFPSGHVTRAVFLAAFAAGYWSNAAYALAFAWAMLIMISRVLMGRHHVLDVMVAVPVGIAEIVFTVVYLDRAADYLLTYAT